MADLKEAFRRLDPASPLDGNLRDAYYVGRPSDPVGKLSKLLTYSDSPQQILLIGQRGVGKTTELLRLAHSLNEIETNSLAFLHSIQGQDIESPEVAARHTLSMVRHALSKKGQSQWLNPEKFFDSSSFSATWAGIAREVITDVKASGRKLILLVDGMEKLHEEDFRKAAIFVAELRRLECSVVAAAPLALGLAPEFSTEVAEWDRVVTLPAVSIQTRNGEPDTAGRGLLQSVIEQRIGGQLFDEDAMAFVIQQSGGILRELLTIAQDACLGASMESKTRVSLDHVKAAVDERRLTQSSRLTSLFHKALDHVRTYKRIENSANLLQLLERNLVVAYQDTSTWFDVHPMIASLIELY